MGLFSLFGINRWIDSWSERIRQIAAEWAGGLEARALLVQLEWAEEKRHLQRLIVCFLLCIGLAVGVLMGLSLAFVVQFWDTPYRITVAWCIVILWSVFWLLSILGLVRAVRRASRAFELTRREFAKDWDAFKEYL